MKKPAPKRQSTLFRRAARALGADESEERFDAALGKIAKHKPKPVDQDELVKRMNDIARAVGNKTDD